MTVVFESSPELEEELELEELPVEALAELLVVDEDDVLPDAADELLELPEEAELLELLPSELPEDADAALDEEVSAPEADDVPLVPEDEAEELSLDELEEDEPEEELLLLLPVVPFTKSFS